MSKLNDLIAQLCPNGVEYKTIKEIATDIYRGSGMQELFFIEMVVLISQMYVVY